MKIPMAKLMDVPSDIIHGYYETTDTTMLHQKYNYAAYGDEERAWFFCNLSYRYIPQKLSEPG